MLWEVATSLGTQEYRHLGIASHCSESAPVCNQCTLFCTYNESLVHVINSLVRIIQCLLGNFSPFVYITVLFSKLSIFQVFATSSLMLCLACRCTLLNSWPQLIWTPSPQRFSRASGLSNIVTMLASSNLYSLPRF